MLEGKAAAPIMASGDDEFIELDEQGNPVAKDEDEPKKAAPPRRAPAKKAPAKRAPRADKAGE